MSWSFRLPAPLPPRPTAPEFKFPDCAEGAVLDLQCAKTILAWIFRDVYHKHQQGPLLLVVPPLALCGEDRFAKLRELRGESTLSFSFSHDYSQPQKTEESEEQAARRSMRLTISLKA